jgi:hypothetical protein
MPKTVLEMTIEELQEVYHGELTGLKFESDQGVLFSLLTKVGNNIEAFFRDLANTSCKEKVHFRKILKLSDARESFRDQFSFRDLFKEFDYFILPRRAGFPWTEDRTDNKGRPANQNIPGIGISKGFAFTCVYLHPDHQKGSLFRYLGREEKKTGAHIIAFAQKPEAGDYLTGYNDTPLLIQGLVWLNPDNQQILRMKTSLLHPTGKLKEQTTDIYYQEVRFDGIPQSFWLPKVVEITLKFPDVTYKNQHKYSDFRLFSVETDYKLDRPQTNK